MHCFHRPSKPIPNYSLAQSMSLRFTSANTNVPYTHTFIHTNTPTYILYICTKIRPLSLNSWEINFKTTTTGIQTHSVVMIRYGSSSLSADLRAERVQKDPHTISHNLEKLKLEGNWITSELTQPRWPPAPRALWRFRASNPDPSSSPHSLPCLVHARISIRSCQIPSNTPQRWWTISSGFLNAQIGRKRPVSWAAHPKSHYP